MIKNEKEAIEYWNNRFDKDKCVGWGSHPSDQWYKAKRNAVRDAIRENDDVKTVLDICCGDMKFMMEIPELKNNTVKYIGIEPTKSIYDQITKEFPGKDIRNITPSELIKTKLNREVDIIVCYDFLFHIIEDQLYEDILKWMFHRNVKFVIISYDDVQSKEIRCEAGHYVPRNFSKFKTTIRYWWKEKKEIVSTRKSSLKLNVFESKKRPIGNIETYSKINTVFRNNKLNLERPALHEKESAMIMKDMINELDIKRVIELGTFHGGLTLCLSDANSNVPVHTFDFFIEIGNRSLQDDLEGVDNNIIFYHENILDGMNPRLVDIINTDERVFLYSDNGNKPLEVKMYAPLLKKGDILGVHDYGIEIKDKDLSFVYKHFKPIYEKEMVDGGYLTRLWERK